MSDLKGNVLTLVFAVWILGSFSSATNLHAFGEKYNNTPEQIDLSQPGLTATLKNYSPEEATFLNQGEDVDLVCVQCRATAYIWYAPIYLLDGTADTIKGVALGIDTAFNSVMFYE